MPANQNHPNTIPEAHVREDKNTPGDISGDQSDEVGPVSLTVLRVPVKTLQNGAAEQGSACNFLKQRTG